MGQPLRQLLIWARSEEVNIGTALKRPHISLRIRLTDRPHQDETPIRPLPGQGCERREIQLVSIDGPDEQQPRGRNSHQIPRAGEGLLPGPGKVIEVGHIAEQVRVGIQRRQGTLELRRRCEHHLHR